MRILGYGFSWGGLLYCGLGRGYGFQQEQTSRRRIDRGEEDIFASLTIYAEVVLDLSTEMLYKLVEMIQKRYIIFGWMNWYWKKERERLVYSIL